MNTSQNKYDAIENLIYNEGLRITSVEFEESDKKMVLQLTNNITFIISTAHYSTLKNAPDEYLKNYKLIGNGTGIHWPDLDEDLSLKGFFNELLKQMVSRNKQLVISE